MVVYRSYHVYILTNRSRRVLYIGATNNLPERIYEHYMSSLSKKTWAGRYNCYYLIYCEVFYHPADAFHREYEIKKWRREKKLNLIKKDNPDLKFLNSEYMEWPPDLSKPMREELQWF